MSYTVMAQSRIGERVPWLHACPLLPGALRGALGETPLRYDVARSDLERLLAGEPRYRADQVWHGLHQRGLDLEEMTDLPKALRERLGEELRPGLTLVAESESDGG